MNWKAFSCKALGWLLAPLLSMPLFFAGCTSGQEPEPVPPTKNVFDPLTQTVERAQQVQSTVDQSAESARKALEAQEHGDASP